jgi:hypothetical protein
LVGADAFYHRVDGRDIINSVLFAVLAYAGFPRIV